MWSDNETTEDLIGFEVHVDLLQSLIQDENLLPLTVGLFGDWGNGKSSIMNMLNNRFSDDDDTFCIYFNGWLFEGYDDAKSAILSSIVNQLIEARKDDETVRQTAKRLLNAIKWMRIFRLGSRNASTPLINAVMTGGTSLGPEVFGAAAAGIVNDVVVESDGLMDREKLEKMEFANYDPTDVKTFRDRFSELIDTTKFKRLIILVDDLDRCSPDRLIDNLEAIKLFLNVNKTAFIIGADPRIIRFSISTRYRIGQIKDEEIEISPNDLIRDYLEKLIQVPYHLPKLSPAEVETYMVLLFSQKELSLANYHLILESYKKKSESNRYAKFDYSDIVQVIEEKEMSEGFKEKLSFIARSSELITEGLKGNPRQVKRFLNAFTLRRNLADVAKLTSIQDDILVKLMILEYVKPKLFKILFSLQATHNGFPPFIKKLEENPDDPDLENIEEGWKSDTVRKWIAIDPPLSQIDLRDYFWIARDRLDSTLSNTNLVSPVSRLVFQKLIIGVVPEIESAVDEFISLQNIEQESILELLSSKILREPDNFDNYKPFRVFAEKKYSDASSHFLDVLSKVQPKDLPPALTVLLGQLLKLYDGNDLERLQERIEKLKESKTIIGKALTVRKK